MSFWQKIQRDTKRKLFCFEILFWGATAFLGKDAVSVEEKYFTATENGEETDVRMGQSIGSKPVGHGE